MSSSREHIRDHVKDQLAHDARVNERDIEVAVTQGTVMLTGAVPNHLARQAASADASAVPGVTAVQNLLSVRYAQAPPNDEELLKRVESTLRWSPAIEVDDLRLTVAEGKVTLRGAVDALWKKHHAQALVCHLAGVVDVDDKLLVLPARQVPDEAVAEAVSKALHRHARVDARSVEVIVEDGRATLRGSVADWQARQIAEELAACTPGVTALDDQLSVRP